MPAMLPPPAHVQPPAEVTAVAEAASSTVSLSATHAAKRRPVAPYGWHGYRVQPGDTLYDIARSHGLSQQELADHNKLRDGGHALRVGQYLSVPRNRPVKHSTGRAGGRGHSSRVATYVVRPGDTLDGIAVRFRIPLTQLLRANRMTSSTVLRPGQRIVLPGHAAAKKRAKSARNSAPGGSRVIIVVIRPGDTISGIAGRYHVSVASLLKANHLQPNSVLAVGAKVTVVVPSSGKGTTSGRKGRRTSTGSTTTGGLTGAAAKSKAWLNSHPAPSRAHVRAMIVRAAAQHGVDRRLALAIGYQESGWNQRAVSPVNAIGVMQCMPSTGEWMSQVLGRRLNIMLAEDNIHCGVGLLRTLSRSAKDEKEVIAAYYQGLGSVRQRGLYEDTKAYVASVLAHKQRM